ncbi:TIGR03773 family transporter-associated surface protein [Actinoplanes sp. CA-054009]
MKRLRSTAVTVAASLAALTPSPALAAPPAPNVDGADLVTLSLTSGTLHLAFRHSDDPSKLSFTAERDPVGVVPTDPDFAFLGRPGAQVWALRDAGSRLPAFNTTAVDPGAVNGGAVTLRLTAVEGPGAFTAYALTPWGRPTLLLHSDGQPSTRLPAGHRTGGVVWAFSAPGQYRVTLRAEARTPAGPTHDEKTYSITVPGPPTPPTDPAPLATPTPPPLPTPAVSAPSLPAPTASAPTLPASGGESPEARIPEISDTRSVSEPEVALPQRGAATAPGTLKAAPGSAAGTSTASAARKVISDGHVDMGPQLSGGALTIRLKDDSTTPPIWRNLGDVVLRATDKARIAVPAGAGYAFLGTAGEQVYLLPQSQQSGIVWPGWNTQHESVVGGTRGNVTWKLRAVDGPGAFKLFLTGSFGTPEVIFDSARPLPQQLGIAPNTHAHGNWAFTKAGLYRLTVDMTATTTAGKTVSDTRTLTIAVGDATGTGSTPGNGGDPGKGGGPGSGNGNGGGGETDNGAGEGATSGNLARTGVSIVSIAGGGVLLLAAGAAALALARRRHPHSSGPN